MAGFYRPPFVVPPGPYAMPGQPYPFSPRPVFPQPHMALPPPHFIPPPMAHPMPGFPPPPYVKTPFPPGFVHPQPAPHFIPQHHRGPSFTMPMPMPTPMHPPPPPPVYPFPMFETHWPTGTPPPLYVPYAPSAFPIHASGIPMSAAYTTPHAPPMYTVPPQHARPQTAHHETSHAMPMPHPQTPGRRHMRTKSGNTFTFETRRVQNLATRFDADQRGIPSHFRIDEWDPEEEPILLFGNAWDIQSLGKYIFDWSCYQYGAGSPLADVAADLWIQAIRLASFVNRASSAARSSTLQQAERVLLLRYVDEGQKIWQEIKKLIKTCERATKRPISIRVPPKNGTVRDLDKEEVRKVVDFVRHLLDRDRHHCSTEDILTSIHNFNARAKDRGAEKLVNKVLHPRQD